MPANRTPEPGAVAPWQESVHNGLGSVGELRSIASSGGTHVIVGQRSFSEWFSSGPKSGWDERRMPAIWASTDGIEWQSAILPNDPAVDRFVQVVAGGPGFVAVGVVWDLDDSGWSTSRVYTSVDGRDWTLAGSLDGEVERIAAVAGRLVAFGTKDGQSAAWVSNDGSGWLEATDPSAAVVTNGLLALHADPGGLYAVRTDSIEESPTTPIEVWRTTGGESWTKTAQLPRSAPAGEGWYGIDAWLAAGPGGWVVVVGRYRAVGPLQFADRWFAWHSSNGVDWQRTDSAPARVTEIVAGGAAFIATGRDYGGCCAYDESQVQGVMWVSSDGMSWHQLPEEGWFGREINFVTVEGGSVVGIGIDWTLSPAHDIELGTGAVWTVDRSLIGSGE